MTAHDHHPPAARPPPLFLLARQAVAGLKHSSLLRNGYSLIASAGLTSVLGLAFWAVAARLYTPEEVGIGAALISTMLTLGNIAQLNLGNLLNRYLPSAGCGAPRLILIAYGIAGTAAALFASTAVFFITRFVPELAFLRDQPLSGAGFVIATVAWTLFALQDSVLAGLRRATIVPAENTLFAVAKLVLLVAFSGSALLGSGLYSAWVAPLPMLLALINWFIFFRILPRHRAERASIPDRHAIARYFGWDYLGTLASMTALGIAPLIVLRHGGAGDLVIYYISFEIAYSVYLISRSMGISLLAEAAHDRTKLHRLVIDALIYTLAPLLAAVSILTICAPLLLPLLGAQYAEASPNLLRLFALSCLPWGIVTLMLAVARATGRVPLVAVAQITTLAIVLIFGMPLSAAYGGLGMATAWLIAHSVTAIGLFADLYLRLTPSSRVDLALRILSTMARLWGFVAPRGRSRNAPPLAEVIAQFGDTIGLAADPGTVREFRRESDVRTGSFKTSGPAPEALIFKSSCTPEGSAALTRHIIRCQMLAAEPALKGLDFGLSSIVASHSQPSGTSLLERAWSGEDGRAVLAAPEKHFSALRQAMNAIGTLHDDTASMRVIDNLWLQEWIESGAEALRLSRSRLMDDAARNNALDTFLKQQFAFWAGRTLPLGLGHGDFAPGNLLFDTARSSNEIRLSAIIDWEASSMDAPAGLDELFLMLTARAQRNGEELGFVVRHFLEDPTLSQDELETMAKPLERIEAIYQSAVDPIVLRALCGLAWWRHVVCNITKSARFSANALWLAANVDLVLAWYGCDWPGNRSRPAVTRFRWRSASPSMARLRPIPIDRFGRG